MTTHHALNIGIIGAARVAVYAMIAPAQENPRAHVAAIAARDPVRARGFATAHGVPHVHETYSALMVDPDIDLVYIATPPAFHAEHAIAALRAGKHVLVEKPFAMNAAQAAEMVAAAGLAGRRVFEAFHYRHHALWQRIVDIVGGGQLGALKAIDAAFYVPIENAPAEFRWHAELGGGALMDLGCYPLQWARVVTGEEPVVSSARMRFVAGVDAETQAELRFPSGLPARISCGMDGDSFKAFVTVEGTFGQMSVMNPLAPQMGHLLETRIEGVVRNETVDGPATFAAQLEAVVAALRDGAPFVLADDDPIKSMAAIDVIRAAALSA